MKYSLEELICVDLAHTLKDNETGFTGLATGGAAAVYITSIPVAAMRLAQKTHAPNLTILLCGVYHNPDLTRLKSMPDSEYAQEMLDLPVEGQMNCYPGFSSHLRGDVSFGFGSGVQVDKEGNLNCTCIGDPLKPRVQLVGPALVPEHFACFGREYIMMPNHDKRNFVEKVDYVSGVGQMGGAAGRRALGLKGGGPKYIYTPKCVFAFDGEGKIYVRSIHPGVTTEEVIESTGFELGDLSGVPTTPEPTDEELRILREEVDPNGLLLARPE